MPVGDMGVDVIVSEVNSLSVHDLHSSNEEFATDSKVGTYGGTGGLCTSAQFTFGVGNVPISHIVTGKFKRPAVSMM